VRTQIVDIVCPLLSSQQRAASDVEREVRDAILANPQVREVNKVTVHFQDTALICVESTIKVTDGNGNIKELQSIAQILRNDLLSNHGIHQADIYLDLSS